MSNEQEPRPLAIDKDAATVIEVDGNIYWYRGPYEGWPAVPFPWKDVKPQHYHEYILVTPLVGEMTGELRVDPNSCWYKVRSPEVLKLSGPVVVLADKYERWERDTSFHGINSPKWKAKLEELNTALQALERDQETVGSEHGRYAIREQMHIVRARIHLIEDLIELLVEEQ